MNLLRELTVRIPVDFPVYSYAFPDALPNFLKHLWHELTPHRMTRDRRIDHKFVSSVNVQSLKLATYRTIRNNRIAKNLVDCGNRLSGYFNPIDECAFNSLFLTYNLKQISDGLEKLPARLDTHYGASFQMANTIGDPFKSLITILISKHRSYSDECARVLQVSNVKLPFGFPRHF